MNKNIKMKKIDKAKIFDYFMKKHKIKEFTIFIRSYNKSIFGLDALYHTKDFSYAMCDYYGGTKINWLLGIVSDFICKKKVSKQHDNKTFSLKDFPKIYKESVIDHCIGTGISVIMSTANGRIVLIPASNCLEELAIKMELES